MHEGIAVERQVLAVVQANLGKKGTRQFPVKRVRAYACEASMDVDVDQFSIDIGDPHSDLDLLLKRDVEIRASLYTSTRRKGIGPLFTGFGDKAVYDSESGVLSVVGRDNSCLAVDSDALPGKWRNVKPHRFIPKRAHDLGMTQVKIPTLSEIAALHTDGSENEWQLWYRMVRQKQMWMWTEPGGALVIDKLNYALKPSYHFGYRQQGNHFKVVRVQFTKDTQGRIGQAWVYGEDKDKGIPYVSRAIDTSIKNWTRQPLKIVTSDTAKSTKDATKEAKDEVFESIVGAIEIEITIRDPGYFVKQNRMARVNLPDIDLVGNFFVVGTRIQGGIGGCEQVIRLREKGYALSRRVPEAPEIDEDPGVTAVTGTITAGLVGVPWAQAFVRGTKEHGVKAGWDFALFLGVLLSICAHESSFHNWRGIVNRPGVINRVAWYPKPEREFPDDPPADIERWLNAFANERGNPRNPRGSASNTAVGPMQLVSDHYRTWADQYGWNGKPKHDEYEGGRWNPESNIRAAARALVEKLNVPPRADPNRANTIWIGVKRYYGSTSEADNEAYMRAVKKLFDEQYGAMAEAAVAAGAQLPPGEGTNINIPGHGPLMIPDAAPNAVRRAINFCLRRLGDPYQWGGGGPLYDCSSFVTAALVFGDPDLKDILDEPHPGHHGETTVTLFRRGRFPAVAKDNLLAGDLVFFRGNPPGHMGMFLGSGLMIHDPRTGDVVKVSSINSDYYRDNWSGARRVIAWTRGGPD